MLLFCAKTIVKESCNFELARLKKKKKEGKTIWQSGKFWVGTFAMLIGATRCVVGREALENQWYVVIKTYKFTVFEILQDSLYYHILCVRAIPICRVYRLHNNSYTLHATAKHKLKQIAS